jgi:hypothetical protein
MTVNHWVPGSSPGKPANNKASVTKLVTVGDLKSPAFGLAGSSPASRTKNFDISENTCENQVSALPILWTVPSNSTQFSLTKNGVATLK